MTLILRILAAMLGAVTLAVMMLAAVILVLAITLLMFRRTISISISLSRQRLLAAEQRKPNDSQHSKQK